MLGTPAGLSAPSAAQVEKAPAVAGKVPTMVAVIPAVALQPVLVAR